MATVTNPVLKPFNRADADRRVRHPLHAIRGYIRRYVLVEGIALTVLCAAVFFWLWLALDFLSWNLFSFDWLYTFNELTGTGPTILLRTVLLVIVVGSLAALIGFKVFRRLFKEFSDPAVAMLLERRYPRQLGDRLITAVELADPKLSEKYGYSQQMVDATIRDAAERVQKLPVQELFRWWRLRLQIAAGLLLTVGMLLFVAVAWCAVTGFQAPHHFPIRFYQTASIWGERNVLMQRSYWPPDSYLELVRFQGHNLRVPRDEDRPDVKVRYVRWCIADSSDEAPRGWRPLRFEDLKELMPAEMLAVDLPENWGGWVVDLDDLDANVPNGVIPPEWGWQGTTSGHVRRQLTRPQVQEVLDRGDAKHSIKTREYLFMMLNWHNWTVDRIETQLDYRDPKARKKTIEAGLVGAAGEAALLQYRQQPVAGAMQTQYPEAYARFKAILEKLEELSQQPTMARTLRQMDDPGKDVIATRKSKVGAGNTVCDPIENRKYVFSLKDLKETCQFSVVAVDPDRPWASASYWTPWREITLVPPPMINEFRIDKEEPAYLYYSASDPDLLKAKRQRISSVSISTTAPISNIEVPHGSHVTIVAHADVPLKDDIRIAAVELKKRKEPKAITPTVAVTLAKDQQTFTCELLDVEQILEFDFEFKDLDGVKGSRRVLVTPMQDQDPKVKDLAIAVVPRIVTTSDEKGVTTRYVVTPDAFIKLRGKIEDDHGLARLQYKFELQELDFQNLFAEQDTKGGDPKDPKDPKSQEPPKKGPRTGGVQIVTAGLQFMPGATGYPLFGAAYFGAIEKVVRDGSLPPPPPQVRFADLERFKQRFNKANKEFAVKPAELERLLNIQPAYRKLLLEALGVRAEANILAKFAEQLKDANQMDGFLREVMDFAGIPARSAERTTIEALARKEPAEALARVLQKLQADPVQLDATRVLLAKEPEKAIITKFDLQDEDFNFGFDIREQLRFIKATSGSDQKHYSVHLSIVATDNNIKTGPGVASVGLPFSFLVVSENELLTLMLVDQKKYAELLKRAIDDLESSRQKLEGQLLDYRKNPDEPTKLLVRADGARKSLRTGAITAKAIHGKMEAMLKEMEFNRMQVRHDKLKSTIVDPLGATTANNGGFVKTEDLANKLYRDLSPDADKKDKADQEQRGNDPALINALLANKDTHIKNADQTLAELNDLIRDLYRVFDAMALGIGNEQLVELMVLIEAQQRQLDIQLRRFQEEFIRELQRLLLEGK